MRVVGAAAFDRVLLGREFGLEGAPFLPEDAFRSAEGKQSERLGAGQGRNGAAQSDRVGPGVAERGDAQVFAAAGLEHVLDAEETRGAGGEFVGRRGRLDRERRSRVGALVLFGECGRGRKNKRQQARQQTGQCIGPSDPDDDTRTQHLTPLPGRRPLRAFHPEISVFVTV